MTLTRPSPLRARRLLRGERLRDVARATGLHETYISLAERGDRVLGGRLLVRLAEHYATPAEVLVLEMRRWASRESEAGRRGGK